MTTTREQQDKLWNELSEETQEEYREKYKFYLVDSKREIECDDGGYDLSILRSQTIVKELEYMFGSHNLNPKLLTYEEIVSKTYKDGYNITLPCNDVEHGAKIDAINKLIIVAKYLNGDWKPDWENIDEEKWSLFMEDDKLEIAEIAYQSMDICFRTEELVQQAIQILGEETIRLALSTDY